MKCFPISPAARWVECTRRGVVKLGVLASLIVCASCSAQPYDESPSAPIPAANAPLDDLQIDQLTSPIALYPDPLLAQLLPAATYPLDVVSASQWMRANPNATEDAIDAQPWDASVKAIVHYPSVLQKMSDDIDWTQQLGEAYLDQPADVMNSIQRLRAEAQAAGSLVTTPQQQVIVEEGAISIIPAEPEVIYVPQYDPAIVYVRRAEPFHDAIRFGTGFRIGVWLDKDTDWHHHWISEGVHWDRDHWHGPPQVIIDRRREKPSQLWVRDPRRPMVTHEFRPDSDEHRGYAAPHAPLRGPPRGFGDYNGRRDVEREENRGRQSLRQPAAPSGGGEHPAAHAPAPAAPHQAPAGPAPGHGDGGAREGGGGGHAGGGGGGGHGGGGGRR